VVKREPFSLLVPGAVTLVANGTEEPTGPFAYIGPKIRGAQWYELVRLNLNGRLVNDLWLEAANPSAGNDQNIFVVDVPGHASGAYQWWFAVG